MTLFERLNFQLIVFLNLLDLTETEMDEEGMQVPYELLITGYNLHIEILKKELVTLEENNMK